MSLTRQEAVVVPGRPGATSFALMFALESITRASLATVIPLEAYLILGSARDVSLAVMGVGATGLAASFAIPQLIRLIGRRWVYPLGAVCLFIASLLLLTQSLWGQVGGMLVRAFGTACLNITLNLYIMDYIQKRDLVRSEPLRMLFAATAWTVGPTLGVVLLSWPGVWSAYLFSMICAVLVLGNFSRLRLQDSPAVARATRPPPNPLRSIGRFVTQPRLLLGWSIAFGRTCWWGSFMTYGPVYLLRAGADPVWGAVMVSGASAMLFLTPLWGRIGARIGLRRAIIGAFLVAAVTTILAGLAAPLPAIAALLLMLGALGGTCLDALGNIPFLRAVHSYERPQMITVYRTNLDIADLVTSSVLAVILSFFDVPAVFIASGIGALIFALIARHLPRSM